MEVGRHYAVKETDGDDAWHIAVWDGDVFEVVSDWQHGDRWLPEWIATHVLLPDV